MLATLAAASLATSSVPLSTTGRVITAAAPVTPPRYLSGPGIQVAGYPTLPENYDFPYYQSQINTSTGLLIRQQGTPLPPVENLVRHSDGLWYQAPTNSWEYVSSPLQPYNQASGPFSGKTPDSWALLTNDNFVNLATGEVFNNQYTPVPEIEVAFKDNKAFAVPRDPFQFMQSPFQPYNYPESHVQKPAYVPQMAVAGDIGFKQGYNPATMDILSEIQGLPMNYNYNLNTPVAVPEVVTAPVSAVPYTSLPYILL